jgi:hypothetical protein
MPFPFQQSADVACKKIFFSKTGKKFQPALLYPIKRFYSPKTE